MAQLVVMETAGQLGLLQMCGDMLVGHFLQASLQEINFLFQRSVLLPKWPDSSRIESHGHHLSKSKSLEAMPVPAAY